MKGQYSIFYKTGKSTGSNKDNGPITIKINDR